VQNQQLVLVKDQSERQQKQLSKKFEQAVSFVQNERKQLTVLQGYENDYLKKIKEEQASWTAENTSRYRHFCHQLSQAISTQQSKVDQVEQHLELMRGELCQQQQKLNVLNDVIAREKAETVKLENTILQKEMDEFSSRQFYQH